MPPAISEDVRKRQEAYYRDAESPRFRWLTENPYVARAERRLFEPLARLRACTSILEVGCGEGANLRTLRALGVKARYTGCDCFQEKIEFCRRQHSEATFALADARFDLPFKEESFDGVLIRDLLHHLAEAERVNVVQESLRVLETGGILAIVEGNANNLIGTVYALAYPHERCMLETRSHLLERFVERVVGSHRWEMDMVEPSNLFRLLFHYRLGWPSLARVRSVCVLMDLWQALVRRTTPRRRWAYSLVEVIKHGASVADGEGPGGILQGRGGPP